MKTTTNMYLSKQKYSLRKNIRGKKANNNNAISISLYPKKPDINKSSIPLLPP